jgi:hypothetical protein
LTTSEFRCVGEPASRAASGPVSSIPPFEEDTRCVRVTISPRLEHVEEVRRLMERVSKAASLPPDRAYDLELAVSEAVANAVEHATADGDVEIVAWLLVDRVMRPGADG